MPITTSFIALWFTFSALIFLTSSSGVRIIVNGQPDRDINTFLIILSQGIGAAIAHALH